MKKSADFLGVEVFLMPFVKKLLLLKQIVEGYSIPDKSACGILRAESDSGITELSLSLVNLSVLFGGEYHLFLINKNRQAFCFPLGAKPINLHKNLDFDLDIDKGLSAVLVAEKETIPISVAFGKTEEFEISLSEVKKIVADKFLAERRSTQKKTEQARPESFTPTINAENSITQEQYNDEAVATENYYELEESLSARLSVLKEWNNAELRMEDGDNACRSKEKKEEKSDRISIIQDEKDTFERKGCQSSPFYNTVERELNALFSKFPPDDRLKTFFPDSRWAKIPYSKSKYYVVGEIKEKGEYKYVCYGVPATYSPEPPKELKGYCSFIPLSIFDMHGEGFWMMFQSAKTGECMHAK